MLSLGAPLLLGTFGLVDVSLCGCDTRGVAERKICGVASVFLLGLPKAIEQQHILGH